jgi:signal transduction histidine kinase
LVIDDEESFRQLIAKFLGKQGFDVVVAADGKAGVSLAAKAQPDLILCDLNMPEMDGYAVLASLREDLGLADIPLIFLTGQAEPHQVRQGMNLGADDYLTKPVDLEDLLRAVRVRLQRRQAQRQRQEHQLDRAMQLFGGIVHDLRDPLCVVLGYTNLLQEKQGPTVGGGANPRQILDRMQQAVLRMQAIVSETLFLAKSKMQSLPFDPASIDLREFCEQLVADHDEHERLRFHSAGGPFRMTGDPVRLRQAVDNLLSNALKYSAGPVDLRLSADPNRCFLEVSDQGIGIPPDEQAEVFEPFFRASNTGNRAGHGLGLSVVRSCIEQHGGTVRFVSDCRTGTSFFLELPRSPGRARATGVRAPLLEPAARRSTAVPAEASTPGAGVAGRSRLRGVIVDDDPLVRGVLRDVLDASGQVEIVGEAGTLGQARLLAKQAALQVVFLDVNLPDGSGFDLLPELKPGVSVVFITSAEEYAVHAFDCEAADFLLKPVTPERLKKAIERVRQRLAAQPAAAPAAAPTPNDSFLVKTLTDKRLVKVGEIERIVAYGEYSWVYWRDNRKGALLRKSLKQWLSELPGAQFLRVHRRTIVNLACLERVERLPKGRLQIHLRDTPEPIQVSLRLAPILNRRLKTSQS